MCHNNYFITIHSQAVNNIIITMFTICIIAFSYYGIYWVTYPIANKFVSKSENASTGWYHETSLQKYALS